MDIIVSNYVHIFELPEEFCVAKFFVK